MSVLFICDHRFIVNDQKVHSNTYSYTFFKPYLDVFSNMTVVGRFTKTVQNSELPLASGEGLDFVLWESISTLRSFFGLRQTYKKDLEALIDKHDGVIVRLPSEFGLLAANAARKKGKKCIVEVMGCAWDALWNYGSFRAKVYAPFLYFRMKATVRHAEFVTYDTERFLQTRYPHGKNAISESIPDVRLGCMDEEVLMRRMDKIESLSEKIIFGTIGNLKVDYKGIDIAIGALTKIAERKIHFEYRILGAGKVDKYRLLAQNNHIEDKVFFDGMIPEGQEIDCWLDGIDIYLQPSLAEAFCRSLVKAMSRGCPAIGSNVGGIPELLEKNVIFPSKVTDEFAAIIQHFLEDKGYMRNQAERNFQRVIMYQASFLDQKRRKFLLSFKRY